MRRALICADSTFPGAKAIPLPVTYGPPGLTEFTGAEELFFGALHVVGNAQEIVVDGKGKYKAVGGAYDIGLLASISKSIAPVFANRSAPNRGFRLVVYYKDTEVLVGSAEKVSRKQSQGFHDALKAAQKGDSKKSPNESSK